MVWNIVILDLFGIRLFGARLPARQGLPMRHVWVLGFGIFLPARQCQAWQAGLLIIGAYLKTRQRRVFKFLITSLPAVQGQARLAPLSLT